MHQLYLSAVLLVLMASTQGKETSTPSQAPPPDFCLQLPNTGPCKGLFTRYFFNPKSGLCETFVYGGCGGNLNRFQDQEECLQTCGQQLTSLGTVEAAPSDFCLQPPNTGPCKGRFTRYFFNPKSGLCETFVYGGCGGNLNRFQDQEECVQTCGQQLKSLGTVEAAPPDFCLQPPNTGPCKGRFTRYFFNPKSGLCETFVYGGCGGNLNRFQDQEECVQTCGQQLKSLGTVEAAPSDFCLQPPNTGPCKGRFTRYFFNPKSGLCETFVYGGCGGNLNRFQDQEECVQTCGQQLKSLGTVEAAPSDFCLQPPNTGPCKGRFTRYFFNPKSGLCETFAYGGCGGNLNRFQDQEECLQTCGQQLTSLGTVEAAPSDFCLQPPNTGPCKGLFTRYFFNPKSGLCETFVYGGCGGNLNRFQDQEECLQTCGQQLTSLGTVEAAPSDFCLQPPNRGPCKGRFTRYFFNPKSGLCETFAYGGCGGNLNRFSTQEECVQICGQQLTSLDMLVPAFPGHA
ncbi:actinia tenebrosa protease inhibitors-like [Cavia porcellus]|uniref:actinia tenebrosa protease inhibitors-like n=1 Tax=Cavia porcellus TaxID=10141 RepID=UPI000661EBA6|nr:papilin-like isoform X2 [Cavia porcellus]